MGLLDDRLDVHRSRRSQGGYSASGDALNPDWHHDKESLRLIRQAHEGDPMPLATTPAAVDAERTLLGALLFDADNLVAVLEILSPGAKQWFYHKPHHAIYDAITTLYQRRDPIDLVTVTDALRLRGQLDKIGGAGYLAELLECVVTTVNVVHHARIIRDKAMLRSIIDISSEMQAQAYSQLDDLPTIIASAQGYLSEVAQANTTSAFTDLAALMTDTIHSIDNADTWQPRLTSGFPDLDAIINGFYPANLIILAARPSVGKTAMALQIATHAAASTGEAVVLFSLEMSKSELGLRLVCGEGRVESSVLRRPGPPMGQLINAGNRLMSVPLLIDDSSRLSVLEMRARVERLQAQRPVAMIVLDYLQLLRSPKRHENRTQEISEISRDLKGLAKDLNIPVLALSQLNRDVEKRSDGGGPQLSDLRDGGTIEQDSDVVIFLQRDKQPGQESTIRVIVAKQRNGPTGECKLVFHKEYARFDSIAPQHYHMMAGE